MMTTILGHMCQPFDVDGERFSWREAGSGALVILLHGLGGSRLSWQSQLTGLPHHRVAAWDMPGYGASPPPAEVTFRSLASDVVDFIDTLGEQRAHVVGISFGGMIAQYVAAWHPEVVRSLTLLSTSPAFGLDGTDAAGWQAARLAPLEAGLRPTDFAEQVLRGIAGPYITDEAFEEQRIAMARVPAAGLRRSIACLVTHDSRALLADITAPTLCLVGELDEETPPQYAQYLAAHIGGARLEIIPAAGHLLNAEAPDAVNRLIVTFIDDVEAP